MERLLELIMSVMTAIKKEITQLLIHQESQDEQDTMMDVMKTACINQVLHVLLDQ